LNVANVECNEYTKELNFEVGNETVFCCLCRTASWRPCFHGKNVAYWILFLWILFR
jgi:hypothetical protein